MSNEWKEAWKTVLLYGLLSVIIEVCVIGLIHIFIPGSSVEDSLGQGISMLGALMCFCAYVVVGYNRTKELQGRVKMLEIELDALINR